MSFFGHLLLFWEQKMHVCVDFLNDMDFVILMMYLYLFIFLKMFMGYIGIDISL